MISPSYLRRLAALFIDWVAAILLATLITGQSYLHVNPFVTLAVFVAMTATTTGLAGLTLGKALLGLRVVGTDGSPIGVPRALLRAVLLSLVVPALIQNADKRGIHDVVANARVVQR